MFKKYYLLVLMGLFLMVGCQKETIMPVNCTNPSLRDGGLDDTFDGITITDPNNEDEEEDNDQITDPNNEDEEEDNDHITDPNNEDEEEDNDNTFGVVIDDDNENDDSGSK